MNSLRLFSLLLAFVLPFGSARAATGPIEESPAAEAERPSSDEAARKLMRGHWILAHKDPDTSAVTVALVLAENGRLTLDEDYKTESGMLRITKKGKWWVKDGIAYGEFTESSEPERAPAGYTTRDTILRLDERVMELRTKEGSIERWERNIG